MSVTQGEVKPRSNGPNRPAAQRRRQQARRRASGSLLRRPKRRLRGSTRSWESPASICASGRGWGGSSSPERGPRRRPEFGPARARGYAWRASELRGWAGSWEIHELEVVLGREFGDLQRRRRHHRRSRARGSGGIEATGRNRRGKEGGEAWELTAVP